MRPGFTLEAVFHLSMSAAVSCVTLAIYVMDRQGSSCSPSVRGVTEEDGSVGSLALSSKPESL